MGRSFENIQIGKLQQENIMLRQKLANITSRRLLGEADKVFLYGVHGSCVVDVIRENSPTIRTTIIQGSMVTL